MICATRSRPYFSDDVVDDPVASFDGEVDVHVRHRLAAWVEKPFEEQVVLDRVDVGDVEAIRDERACGRTAPGPDLDAVALRVGDEVPDDQEVVREAHLADRLELELEPVVELVGGLVVALFQAFFGQLDEVVEAVALVGRRELRQQDAAELHRHVAAFGHLERATKRVVVAGEVERHLLRRLEVEVVGVELPVLRVLERVAGLDAEQRLVRARVLVLQVVDVAGRDEPEPGSFGHLRQERVDSLLRLEVRVLHLDVGRVLAEDLDEPVHLGGGVGGPGFLERLADASGEAAGERDQSLGVGLEELPVDARLVVVTLEVAGGGELDQVRSSRCCPRRAA